MPIEVDDHYRHDEGLVDHWAAHASVEEKTRYVRLEKDNETSDLRSKERDITRILLKDQLQVTHD
jgi:hypothetical protein